METLELEKETFNIDLSMQHKVQKTEKTEDDILFVIAQIKNPNFKLPMPYDIALYGKKMWEWVALAGDGCEIKTISMTEEGDILALCKPFLKDKKYTAIFYSDTPLLTKSTFMEIFEYFTRKDLNVLKLTRGYIFKTDYLRECTEVMAPACHYFDGEDFITCFDFKQLSLVQDILKNRILDFHMRNGVNIINPLTTYIDADVIIESGVVIYQNNTLKGMCYIDKNVELLPNNVLENAIVSSGCQVVSSYIKNSKLPENKVVGPFESIVNVCD